MIDRRKVFAVTFGAVYAGLLVFGLMHEQAGAFPTRGWVLAYLALTAVWAGLAAITAVGAVVVVQNSRFLSARAGGPLRRAGRWFTK